MMRAALYERYGGPEVLHVADVPRPAVGKGRALVRVVATSVNPIEARVRSGALRVATGWFFPKATGLDFYGDVVEAGENYSGPSVGEFVWGFRGGLPDGKQLAASEFVSVKAGWMSRAPQSAGADAGALPLVASTALSGLTRVTSLQPGERLLVRGASGGVGSAAVQLGKHLGAHVTALAGADNLELVRALGADVALDYRSTTPAAMGEKFDVILDVVGVDMRSWRRLLAPGGRYTTTAVKGIAYTLFSQLTGKRRIRPIVVMPRPSDLATLAGLVDDGALRPVVGARFPLDEIAEAHAALDSAPGKVLVTIG